MPVIYRCSRCGKVIYVFMRAGQDYYGVPTPSELSARFGGTCPHCGNKIRTDVSLEHITIKFRT